MQIVRLCGAVTQRNAEVQRNGIVRKVIVENLVLSRSEAVLVNAGDCAGYHDRQKYRNLREAVRADDRDGLAVGAHNLLSGDGRGSSVVERIARQAKGAILRAECGC